MRDANYTETIEFLSAFFRGTEQAVELRALRNNGGATQPLFTRNPDEVVAYCQHYDGLGWGLYFGLATRDSLNLGGKRENLRELPCLWAEIDIHKFGMSVEVAVGILLACPLPPSLIVSSGRGLHVYWLLSPPFSVTAAPFGEDAEKVRVELVTRSFVRIFRGDPNAVDLTRVLRLPGTHNTKEGSLLPCRVLEATWTRYELEQVEAFAALSPVLIEAPATDGPTGQEEAAPLSRAAQQEDDPYAAYGTNWREPFDMGRLDLMSYQDADNPIHQTRLKAAASMVQRGELDDDAIFEHLLKATHRAAGLAGERWDWRREEAAIHREIASAHKKWPPPSPKVVQLRPGQQAEQEPKPAGEVAPEFMGFPLNDLGNAFRLLAMHRPAMRYVLNIGWHIWDKRRFAYDPEEKQAQLMAQRTVREIWNQAFSGKIPSTSDKARAAVMKFAAQCGNSGRIANMLGEASPHVAVAADVLDADPWALNCRNGTVDLRTGELRPHAQADLITKLCGAAYDPDAACPQWNKFLLEIFDGDGDLIRFVQRCFGYSLTGDCREQVLFILHGTGANGKSVLIDTVSAVMGEYVKHSPAETWVAKPAGAATNDIAALVGARFVSVVETERDRNLAEALVKQATGGDKITARFHRQEFFSYTPQFKLWFATNHRPKIRGSNYAIWRRIYLLPFMVKFVPADEATKGQMIKDGDLTKNLRSEFPGILAWMVRGCIEWQRIGLKPPEAVKAATEAYQDAEDNVSGFLRECCAQARGIECSINLLHAGYEVWCEENDVVAQDKRAFGRNLDDRGYPPGKRTKRDRLRKGIDLTQEYRELAISRLADDAEKS